MIASLTHGLNSIGIDIEPEYCKMAARYLKAESSSLFTSTDLQFEKMVFDNIGRLEVCECEKKGQATSAALAPNLLS